ncbi:helix-turn-helix domain-containing protein [Methylobacter sp.]|uniref:helix-turn-helix domain-containing protein n=1 Tax=Methylobacter sp. TaxID=2051955 RepID=UPI00248A2286|nr:helix-turn-helix domain-containing protein [Methylobacter sp.]MDI1277295.1 helix-turn-helix domain-containing protein [Methylobacter sp.]MDI1357861.1 helix-turn-helix domain-containing protein [Methylobacter sp.]
MSVKMMSLAWKLPLNSMETLVILALADAANDEGFCYPGYESLIEKTKLARATLAKTLGILEGAGIFEKKPHSNIGEGRKVNTYQLLFNESWFHVVTNPPKSSRFELIESIRLELIGKIKELRENQKRPISSNLSHRKVQPSDTISSIREHEPSIKPSLKQPSLKDIASPKKAHERKKTETANEILAEFGITGQLADDFIAHRKAKKASITATALNGFQREADKAGISIVAAITISIERGWQGFNAGWDWQPKQAGQIRGGLKQPAQRIEYTDYQPLDENFDNMPVITGERVI